MLVRVGIPVTGGRLVSAAREANMPVLFSANAFMLKDKETGQARARKPKREQFEGLNAALDSAGFVAAATYRGFPWTVGEYLDLAESFPWAWYSSMDYCVEPEVAGSTIEVMFRLAETCRLYTEVSREARDRGMAAPMPVLQGWEVEHYLWSINNLPLIEWPGLVGVGSMCRRDIHGPHGILAVVEALDRALPAHVQFHLFGVKGRALEYLKAHPRIASVDSMAWDSDARRKMPTGRTMDKRIGFMFDWTQKNCARLETKPQHYSVPLFTDPSQPVSDELAEWLDLVVSNEVDARSAACHCHHLCLSA